MKSTLIGGLEMGETIYKKSMDGYGSGKLKEVKIEVGTSPEGGKLGIHLHHDGQWHTYTHDLGGFFANQRRLRRRWFMLGLAVGMLVGVLFGVIL